MVWDDFLLLERKDVKDVFDNTVAILCKEQKKLLKQEFITKLAVRMSEEKDQPREAHLERVGDLIVSSGMSNIFDYLLEQDKLTVDKQEEVDGQNDPYQTQRYPQIIQNFFQQTARNRERYIVDTFLFVFQRVAEE